VIAPYSPESWITKALGDVLDIKGGSQPPKSEFIYKSKDGYVQLLQIRDFGAKPQPTFVPIGKVTKFCQKDDILVARYGASLGRIVTGHAGAYNVALAKLIPLPGLLEKRYLYYLLQTPVFQTPLKMISRSAQNGFAKHEIAHVQLPIAPINEQRRIVAKIEELFSELEKGVENLKTARAQLKTYRQSLLKAAFEGRLTEQWRSDNSDKIESADQLLQRIREKREVRYKQQLKEWEAATLKWGAGGKQGTRPKKLTADKPLSEIETDELDVLPFIPQPWQYVRLAAVATVGSGMSVSKSRKLSDPVEVPYLQLANVQRGKLILDEIKTMAVERMAIRDLSLEKWDVLFNEGGDRDKLGRGWVWEDQIKPCITQNHVFRATTYLGDEFHAKFISYWGNVFGRDYFEKVGKQTTNLASINKTVLKMFPIPIPPYDEQREIVRRLEVIETEVTALEQQIEEGLIRSNALRQSILKRAFEGKLVPQDPDDEPASALLKRIRQEQSDQPKTGRRKRKAEALA